MHAITHDSRRGDRGGHLQRRLLSWPAQTNRSIEVAKQADLAVFEWKLPGNSLLFWSEHLLADFKERKE